MGLSLNPLNDISSAVKGAVSAFVPGEAGKVLGDIAAGTVDVMDGNLPNVAADGMSALQDLQQANGGKAATATATSTPASQPLKTEPPPPPGVQRSIAGMTLGHFESATLHPSGASPSTPAAPPGAPPPAPSATSTTSATPAPTTPAPTTPVTSTPAGSTPAAASSTASATTDASKLTSDQFMALGDDALMQAVRDGKIPQAVSDSPTAMRELQARMDNITEMNQLMTQMLQALHQMQMSIIQNVRA